MQLGLPFLCTSYEVTDECNTSFKTGTQFGVLLLLMPRAALPMWWMVCGHGHAQMVDLVFVFLFSELYDICLARAKEKWRSLSTGGAEVECEGRLFVKDLCCDRMRYFVHYFLKMKSRILNNNSKKISYKGKKKMSFCESEE